jgi:hypothetical protein
MAGPGCSRQGTVVRSDVGWEACFYKIFTYIHLYIHPSLRKANHDSLKLLPGHRPFIPFCAPTQHSIESPLVPIATTYHSSASLTRSPNNLLERGHPAMPPPPRCLLDTFKSLILRLSARLGHLVPARLSVRPAPAIPLPAQDTSVSLAQFRPILSETRDTV